MAILPVVPDFRPTLPDGRIAAGSLLQMPLGARTLLGHLLSRVAEVTREPLTVVIPETAGPDYTQAIQVAAGVTEPLRLAADFSQVFSRGEPSDWFLILDPRYLPAGAWSLPGLAGDLTEDRGARYLVVADSTPGGIREYVLADTDGVVSKIQRYYEGVTWVKTSHVVCALVSGSSALLIRRRPFTGLSDLRQALAGLGVPGQDITLPGPGLDLTDDAGWLRANEPFILAACSGPVPSPYCRPSAEMLVGPGCKIAPSVRFCGPVIVQAGATVEPGATVIGPAILGPEARVRADAVVAQCLIGPGAVAMGSIRHRVVRAPEACPLPDGGGRLPGHGEHTCLAFASAPDLCNGHESAEPAPLRGAYPAIKRTLDVTAALAGLIVLSPLLLLIAILIKLTSRGPVLFGHERECRGGRLFKCWKFRTMVRDAHAHQRELYVKNTVDGPQFKLDHDPRIMPLGRVLRATNLDELPQLLNVVAGHMSLVGPRPSPFRENQICVPWRRARLSVRPGITGLWQICRHDREAGDFHQWIYYDMLYVRHLSFGLDLKILLATVLTLGGRWSVPLGWLIPESSRQEDIDLPRITRWPETLASVTGQGPAAV